MMENICIYKGLNRDMYTLALYRFISGMGYFVIPYLSLFLTGELEISVIISGIVIAGANLFCIPVLYISARITEKIGPKNTIIITQIISALSYIIVVICPYNILKIWFTIVGLCLSSVAVPSMDTWATIKNSDGDRRKVFSLLYLAQNIGFAIGSLVIGFAYKINPDFVFIGDAITTFLAVGILYINTEDTKAELFKKDNTKNVKLDLKIGISIKVFMFIILLNALAYGQLSFMLPVFLRRVTTNGTVLYGFVMAVNAILVIILSPIFTQVFKNAKLIDVIILSELLFALGYGTYGFGTNNIEFVMITILWSIGEVLFSINYMAYIVQNTEKYLVPRVAAMAAIFNKVGVILSSVIGGAFISEVGYLKSWTCISIIMLISGGLAVFIRRTEK